MGGVPTGHYQHLNPQSGRFEVVKSMPAGMPDRVVQEFGSISDLISWVNEQWNNHGFLS
jgi:hypothetical protein